jgi:DNA-binding transcriptional ArsR family regulator
MVRILSLSEGDFPTEIVELVNALSDRRRRRIVLALLEKDPLSYSEIQIKLDAKKGTLNHHLNVLIGSGLLQNFTIRSPGSLYSSYYTITDFGHRFLTGIRKVLEPKQFEIVEVTSTTMRARKEIDHELPVTTNASESEEILQDLLVASPSQSKSNQGR